MIYKHLNLYTLIMKKIIESSSVIPVLTLDTIEEGRAVAELFRNHQMTVLEITLRTANALDIINTLVDEFPELTIGAGTVTNIAQFNDVLHSKAAFAVSPGYVAELAMLARQTSFPYLPGVSTVSEAMQAQMNGYELLKLFPAESVGGVKLLQQMAAVFPGLRFCPTGGIDFSNAASYLQQPNVLCIGMSAVAPAKLIKAQDWNRIDSLISRWGQSTTIDMVK